MQLPALARHRLVGHVLQAGVDGGVHHHPVGVDVVVVAVGPVDQPFTQLLGKVGRGAHGFDLPLEFDVQRPFFQRLVLACIKLLALDHLRQHGIAALHGALGVEHRVVVAGALEHADQRGALQQVELVGRFVEIGARRHLDADGVVEKGHGVEVGLEDFRLGIEGLDLQRGDGFLELAGEGGGAADFLRVQVARQLLRQGGAALPAARKSAQSGGTGAPPVQAVVLIKAMVFGGDQGHNDGGCDLVQRHPGAVGPLELSQQLAVRREHLRGLLQFGLADVADAGGKRNQHQHIEQQQRRHGGQRPRHAAPGGAAKAAKPVGNKGFELGKFDHARTMGRGNAGGLLCRKPFGRR